MKRRHFIALAGTGAVATTTTQTFPQILEQETNWKPDGSGYLGKIGLLTPYFDPVPESEIRAMAPLGISIHSSRIKGVRGKPSSFAEAPIVDNAAELLLELNPKAMLFGWTSSSYVLGREADDQLIQRVEKLTKGIPLILPGKAAMDAFRTFNARKIALIHPPWFSGEMNSKGKAYFESYGFEIVFCNQLTPARTFTEVAPMEVYEWVKNNVPLNINADVIYFSGNGLRTTGAISRLEQELDRPILTANQILLWAALRLIGVNSKVTEYGKVFNKS